MDLVFESQIPSRCSNAVVTCNSSVEFVKSLVKTDVSAGEFNHGWH
jgi:hypothetical protein